MTYYVVFAKDNHDMACVAVLADDVKDAKRQVLDAIGHWVDTIVFMNMPLGYAQVWTIAYVRNFYHD